MKPFIAFFYVFSLILYCNVSVGQQTVVLPSNKNSNEKNPMRRADIVIEGHVISAKCFKTETNIYTSIIVRALKIFKGNGKDSLIEVIEEGGQLDGVDVTVYDGTIEAHLNDEGIFFLDSNKTQISLRTELKSYVFASDFIGYRFGGARVGNHLATCRGVTYDDIEKDLYQPIETATGQKRKVLGLNSFETKEKKQQKK